MEFAVLVLSIMYGVPLSIMIKQFDAKIRPPIINILTTPGESNNVSSLENMRRDVIKFLGLNNVLVGF